MVPACIIRTVGRIRRAWLLIGGLLLLGLVLHLTVGGSLGFDLAELLRALLAGPSGDTPWTAVLWEIRLPRALSCLGVGAILGAAGCAFQLLFRNPLAEPFVVGVSGGAAVGGTLVVSLGLTGLALELGVVAAACVGAVLALGLVLASSWRRAGFHSEQVLIGGVVIGTLLMSLMTLVLLARGHDSSSVLRWMLGSIPPVFWSRTAVLWVVAVVGVGLLMRDSRQLNALSLGSATAQSLGVHPERISRRVLVTGSLMTGVAVGVSGIIGFLGMIVPNIVRHWVGPDARHVLPMSAALAGAVLLVADLLAQQLVPGQEMPVGAITAVLGAPGLLWLLRRAR